MTLSWIIISSNTIDCYKSKVSDNQFYDSSLQQHRSIAINARPWTIIFKIVCLSDRLLSEQGHQEQQDYSHGRLQYRPIAIRDRPTCLRASASAPPSDCYQSKVVDNSKIVWDSKAIYIIDRLLSKQGRLLQHRRPVAIRARSAGTAGIAGSAGTFSISSALSADC